MNAAVIEAPAGIERAWQAALTGALFALGAFAPWSTAGTSIAIGALGLIYLAAPKRTWFATPWRDPVVVVGLVLLVYIAVRSVAADGWQLETVRVANRYHELLMIPLLWALMRLAQRRSAFLYGLLLGALGVAIAVWLPLPDAMHNKLQLRRISLGFGLPVCAFLLYEEARLRRLPRLPGYAAAAFLAITVVAAVGARTGYVVVLLLGACALWRSLPKRWRWPAMAALVALAAVAFVLTSTVRERRGDIAVSNKIRTELLQNTVEVARRNWVLGTGWNGFNKAYGEVAAATGAEPDDLWAKSDNPHNEYLMQAASGGLPALTLFLAWLAIPALAPLRRHEGTDSQTGVLACIAIAFAAGCVFNSMLLDFIEGHLYGALLAWLMAQREADTS